MAGLITDRALEPYERTGPAATGRMVTHHKVEPLPGVSPAWAVRVVAVWVLLALPTCAVVLGLIGLALKALR